MTSSQAETFSRNRRLFDVRRGVVYLRRTDNLAQHQWRHYGTVPAIKTHVIRDIGVTTRPTDVNASQYDVSADQSLAETRESESDVRGSNVDVRESVSDVTVNLEQPPESRTLAAPKTQIVEAFSTHPRISVTEAEDSNPTPTSPPEAEAAGPMTTSSPKLLSPDYQSYSADLPPPAASSSSTSSFFQQGDPWSRSDGVKDVVAMTSSLPAFRGPLSTSKHDQHTFRESLPFPERFPPEGAYFNTWGSRDWATWEAAAADVTPRSYAPKRYPLMSRVVGGAEMGHGREGGGPRQRKTLTDFRSENGTVRVIRPLPPLPGAKRAPILTVQDPDEDLDLHTLEREKTYAMLKRIDRLLEPSRAFFVSDLTSSQREISPASSPATSSDLTESLPGSQPQPDRVHVHQDNFQKYLAEGSGLEGNASGHGKGMSGDRDPHQGYYDRIQARLAQFYGSSDRQVKESSPGRTRPHRGHSEPPRQQRADSLKERSSDPASRGQSLQGGRDNKGRGRYDPQEAFPDNASRPAAARRSRPLPRLKKAVSGSKPESSDDPHTKYCGHSRNVRGGGAGVRRERVKGERGKGWETLGEVVKNLEEKGVDLHLKCQDWIRASFS